MNVLDQRPFQHLLPRRLPDHARDPVQPSIPGGSKPPLPGDEHVLSLPASVWGAGHYQRLEYALPPHALGQLGQLLLPERAARLVRVGGDRAHVYFPRARCILVLGRGRLDLRGGRCNRDVGFIHIGKLRGIDDQTG